MNPDTFLVKEKDARVIAKRPAEEEGIFDGTSTGLNVAAAIELGMASGANHTIVTVACDSGMKYINSNLFDRT